MTLSLYIILLLFLLVIARNKFGRWTNVVSVFSFIWFGITGFASLGVFGYRIPNLTTNIYIVTYVLIVNLIILFFSTGKTDQCEKSYLEMEPINNAFLIETIVLLLLSPSIMNAVRVFATSRSFVAVRLSYFRGDYLSSPFAGLLFKQIPIGMLQGLIIYHVFYSFETKRYKALAVAVFNTVLITVVNGGRYAIMLLIYSILILWMTNHISLSDSKWINKYRKSIKRTVIIILLAMVALTVNRGQVIYRSVIGYFSGSISFLDYIVQNPQLFELDQPLHGYLTFGFILEPIVFLLKYLRITDAKIPSYYFNIVGQNYYNVGNGTQTHYMNANTTIIYHFIRDFGFLGIIIGALLVGTLTVLFYNRWKKKNDRFAGMLFIYMCNVLFNSIMTNQLFANTPLFVFFAIYLCTHLNKTQISFKFGKKRR